MSESGPIPDNATPDEIRKRRERAVQVVKELGGPLVVEIEVTPEESKP